MQDIITDTALQLFRQANDAVDTRSIDEAVMLYLRSLHYLLVQPDPNPRHLAMTFLGLGRAMSYVQDDVALAAACCDTSGLLFKWVGRGEAETDRIYMAALIVNALEDYVTARRMMQTALDRYRALNLTQKIRSVSDDMRDMMHRLGERRYRELLDATAPMHGHVFDISADAKPIHRVSVSREGVLTHQATSTIPALIESWKMILVYN